MAEPLKKVVSGDPLAIPAETFNTFIDMARDYRAADRRYAVAPAGQDARQAAPRGLCRAGLPYGNFALLGIGT